MNVLAEWLDRHGGTTAKRELQRLVEEKAGEKIRWATIHDISRGKSVPTIATARLIEAGTDGEVPALQLMIECAAARSMGASLCHASDGVNCGADAEVES